MRSAIGQVMLASGVVMVAAALASPPAGAQGTKTTWDGVYSAAQSTRGGDVYTKMCASCHKADLSGNDALDPAVPPLIAKELALSFNELTVDALADRIRTSMPKDKPNTLTPEQTADVVAFLLSKGGMPAGKTDLPSAAAGQKSITFIAIKP